MVRPSEDLAQVPLLFKEAAKFFASSLPLFSFSETESQNTPDDESSLADKIDEINPLLTMEKAKARVPNPDKFLEAIKTCHEYYQKKPDRVQVFTMSEAGMEYDLELNQLHLKMMDPPSVFAAGFLPKTTSQPSL
jgi:hypothetical protein